MSAPWKIRVTRYHDGSHEAALLFPHQSGWGRWRKTNYSRWRMLPINRFPGVSGPDAVRANTTTAAVSQLLGHIPASQSYVIEESQ